jgi:hypothetical protein
VLVILPFVVIGWVTPDQASTSLLVLLAASCGTGGGLLTVLSLRRTKDPSISSMAALLCSALGVGVFYADVDASAEVRWVGLGLVVLPLVIGALSFSLRPLQFPAVVVNKQ